MPNLYIGTSGWAYPAWKPQFYPEKLPQKQFLRYYASQLTSVEINYTFRRLITEKTAQGWISETQPDFKFALKAHQVLTHIRKLKDIGEFLKRFLASIQPLAETGRLGPVLFQLPPQFRAAPEVLRMFLADVPRGLHCAFEFRHESWFSDEVFGILRERNVALCVAESEKLESPDVHTADFAYFRLRKDVYTPEERRAIAERVARVAAAHNDVFAFFKHEESPESALHAVELLNTLKQTAGMASAS
jgi:uncharacterized protein YecE (DUF72 family)